jgi:hypothetical protein
MKIKSVDLMRSIRDRINQDIDGMSWPEEQEYLKSHIHSFDAMLKEMPNKRLQPTVQSAARSARASLDSG